MTNSARAAVAAATMTAAALLAPDASALLIEKLDGPGYTAFYPYPTAFTSADPGFAFDDDPLVAITAEPYAMPLFTYRPPEQPALVEPRMTFVDAMVDSGDGI